MNAITKPAAFDVARIRQDFPILTQTVRGKPLVFLDSAASAQKPRAVIDAMRNAMETQYANVHRGLHWMSERTTEAYEAARDAIATLMNASDRHEIVLTQSVTGALNLMAHSYGRGVLQPGQAVVISAMEHHSNIVPWQMLRDQIGIKLVVAPIDRNGNLIWESFEKLLSAKTKLVAVAQVSNALGTILPIHDIVRAAHTVGAKVLIDAAQGAPHMRTDLQALDADFYAFSGHKLYGPTGTGALWGKKELLDAMPPWQGGGDMIKSVSFEKTDYADVPAKFEAGTPNIADVIAMGAAIDYLSALPWDAIEAHEADVLAYGTGLLKAIPGLRLIGEADHKAGVMSFVLEGVHPHDIGTILDQDGVSVRAGNHCAEPVMEFFGVPGTARASLGMYSTRAEMDALAAAIRKVQEIFA